MHIYLFRNFLPVRKPLFFPVSNLDSRRTNRGFVSKSKRLRNEKQGMTNEFEITDEQVKQMKNELSIENYVESFIRTLFPELNGENGYWIIQQLTNDVVNEMNKRKKKLNWRVLPMISFLSFKVLRK